MVAIEGEYLLGSYNCCCCSKCVALDSIPGGTSQDQIVYGMNGSTKSCLQSIPRSVSDVFCR